MTKQPIRLILATITLSILASIVYHQNKNAFVTRVEAVGNLLITYLGVPLGDPVFEVTGFMPGDCETRTIDVENTGLDTAKIAVKSQNEIDTDNLSTQLHFRIYEDAIDLYGGTATSGAKLVSDFFVDSASFPSGIRLTDVAPSASTSYHFEVCFNDSAGNEYQKTSTIFDIVFGELIVPVELPEVCRELEGIVTAEIVGTPGDDIIEGTSASEYIRGLGGHDTIKG
ncbi:hypothetical protein ACFL2V_18590, partial [Pseudomonadota bacterium]